MSVVSRAARLVVMVGLAWLAVGCGGSVADTDVPVVTRTVPPPQTPFCQAVQANSDALRPLNALVARGGGTPAELRTTAEAVRRTGADLVNMAPNEIDTDIQLIVSTLNLQVDALVAAGGATQPADPDLTARLNSPELLSANQRVNTYISRACGRSPNATR